MANLFCVYTFEFQLFYTAQLILYSKQYNKADNIQKKYCDHIFFGMRNVLHIALLCVTVPFAKITSTSVQLLGPAVLMRAQYGPIDPWYAKLFSDQC